MFICYLGTAAAYNHRSSVCSSAVPALSHRLSGRVHFHSFLLKHLSAFSIYLLPLLSSSSTTTQFIQNTKSQYWVYHRNMKLNILLVAASAGFTIAAPALAPRQCSGSQDTGCTVDVETTPLIESRQCRGAEDTGCLRGRAITTRQCRGSQDTDCLVARDDAPTYWIGDAETGHPGMAHGPPPSFAKRQCRGEQDTDCAPIEKVKRQCRGTADEGCTVDVQELGDSSKVEVERDEGKFCEYFCETCTERCKYCLKPPKRVLRRRA